MLAAPDSEAYWLAGAPGPEIVSKWRYGNTISIVWIAGIIGLHIKGLVREINHPVRSHADGCISHEGIDDIIVHQHSTHGISASDPERLQHPLSCENKAPWESAFQVRESFTGRSMVGYGEEIVQGGCRVAVTGSLGDIPKGALPRESTKAVANGGVE